MALNDSLITLEQVRAYSDVDSNYTPDRFAAILKGVQDGELKELLGGALWLDFFKATPDGSIYDDLLDGEEYEYEGETILYGGLRPFLIWAWLNVLPIDGNLHHTQSGDVSYLRDVTTRPTKAEINQVKENYKRNMLIEQNNIVQYLNTNATTYPLWNQTGQVDESRMKISFIN